MVPRNVSEALKLWEDDMEQKPYFSYTLVGEDLAKNAKHYVEHGVAKDVAEALRMMAAKYPVSRLVPYLLDGQTIDTVED